MNTNWLLVFGGIGCVVVEMVLGAATGFDLLLIGLALVVGGGVGMATGSGAVGVVLAAILSGGYIVFGRRLVRSRLKTKGRATNSDRLVGLTGTMIARNQARVESEVWRVVESEDLPAGTKIKVVEVEGSSIKVVKS